jgi:hypothetical protein
MSCTDKGIEELTCIEQIIYMRESPENARYGQGTGGLLVSGRLLRVRSGERPGTQASRIRLIFHRNIRRCRGCD